MDDPRVEYFSFPKFIALEASRLCNLKCTMCALHSDFIDHSHTDHHPKHFRLDKYHWILEQMAPYVGHARRSGGTRKAGGRRAAAPAASGPTAAEVREWARENGWDVPDRGRVSAEVRSAYDAAH